MKDKGQNQKKTHNSHSVVRDVFSMPLSEQKKILKKVVRKASEDQLKVIKKAKELEKERKEVV